MSATGSHSAARTASFGKTTDTRRPRSTLLRAARSAPSVVRCVASGDLQSHVSDAKDAEVTLEASSSRRNMMMAAAATLSLAQMNVAPQAIASDGVKSFSDPLLAYAFDYPAVDANGKELKWFAPRTAERYSSAAPMSADARQRIVYEIIDFSNATPLTLSVSVGPIPPDLKDIPSDQWTPEQLAEAVLEEKSTGRVTTGQRVALSSLEESRLEEKNGTKYWLYEHVAQGSPNAGEVYSKETYRHSLAVTALRGDYIYTFNLSASELRWSTVSAGFTEAQQSFTLSDPSSSFVPPEKNPWRFW
eukprot:CAMPEP_0198209920 /NCGR_PEP_ID=MMETSP1445-20131203/17814_1 /TAXON_ID=36898 /ORGANISM="Pyramimonas sp., Strain CCMP2087" /LENGTH=302 /DNA_ID=CAMNT_0043883835 /DNA_START=92 /DNA_END=1000 /DNA_ORIENTATION=-